MKFDDCVCAFCQSDIKKAATVCPSCGAFKGRVMDRWNFPGWFIAIGALFLSFGYNEGHSVGLVFFMIGIAMFLFVFKMIRSVGRRRTWLRVSPN